MKTAFLVICICAFAIPVYAQNNFLAIGRSIFGKANSQLAGIPKDYFKRTYDSLQKKMPLEKQIPLERLFRERNNSFKGFTFKELPLARKSDHTFKLLPLAKEGDHEFELLRPYYPDVYRRAEKKN